MRVNEHVAGEATLTVRDERAVFAKQLHLGARPVELHVLPQVSSSASLLLNCDA